MAQNRLNVNGDRPHGFTSSRHEAHSHFPAEGRGGVSEAGDGERGGEERRTSNIERPTSKVEGRGELLWDCAVMEPVGGIEHPVEGSLACESGHGFEPTIN